VAGIAAVISLSGYIERTRPQLPAGYEDSDLGMHGSWLKGYAFGTEGLIADWYFMRALQYIGDKMLKQPELAIDLDDLRDLNPRLLYPLLDNATDLDPHFIAAYSYGAMVLPAIDPQKAIDLAKKGIANNPDSWRLYQHLAYIYWKLGRYEDASETYEKGSKIADAAPFMRLMAAAMKTEGGSRETARTIYREMLAASDEEQVRVTAERRLQELDSLDERDAIDKALAEFKEATGRCPSSFSEILPRLAAVDLPGDRQIRIDTARNIVDPTDTPYVLDRQKCKALVDAGRSGIAAR
jgi:tetratricopeptide (TPR) repeat protein